MADPIQITYDSAGIQAKLDAAGTAVQGDALKGLAATLTAGDATSLTATDSLDNLTDDGNYKIGTAAIATSAGAPLNTPGRVVVAHTSAANRYVQAYVSNSSSYPRVFLRGNFGSGFTPFVELISTGSNALTKDAPEMVMVSEFEYIAGGWWTAAGGFSGTTTLYHSQLIPIIPGGRHYLGYLYSSSNVVGAFFDATGNWISSLAGTSVTEFPVAASGSSSAYKTPNGNGGTDNYISLYYFDAPANAYYFSYNLANSDTYTWKQYVSSKPVFMLKNSGNFIVRPGDPVYQAKKDKKLCIIGPSSVMIDRYDRDSQGNDTPYVVGFQEYLAPWYQAVDSYGFSSGAMFPASGESATSIYNGIVTAALDLSGYDEFLISGSTNGLSTDDVVDAWDSTDTSKYFGALNGIISYIYTQNPKAKIYLTDLSRKQGYYTYADSYRARIDTVNERTATLAAKRAYTLIPVSVGSECNASTYSAYTYDGTHGNSAGNRVYGLFCRKCMLGF